MRLRITNMKFAIMVGGNVLDSQRVAIAINRRRQEDRSMAFEDVRCPERKALKKDGIHMYFQYKRN